MSLREWMIDLREREGKLTPAIVLEAARPPGSPAHGYVFNLNAPEAAEAYYLERAHQLIRTVKVTVEAKPEEPPRRVRYFHYVTDDDGEQVYEPLPVITQSVDKFDQVRTAAMERLREAQDSLTDLELLAQEQPRKTAIRKARQAVEVASGAVEAA